MKRIFQMALAGMLLLTALPQGSFALDEERVVYQSSTYFSVNQNGSWDNGIWSAQVYDGYAREGETPSYTYTNITEYTDNADQWGESGAAGDAAPYYKNTVPDKNGNNQTGQRINGYWIAPSPNPTTENDSAVKTFTAPRSGIITVACGGNRFYKLSGYVLQARIMLEKAEDGSNTKVWPADGDADAQYELSDNKEHVSDLPPFTIAVSEGDKLHFELKKKNATDNAWSRVYWDPMITYSSQDPDPEPEPDNPNKRRYQASKSFYTETNGDENWKWQYFDLNEKTYQDLTNTYEMSGFGDDLQSAGTAWTDSRNIRAISVGKYKMRPGITPDTATAGEKEGKIERNYAVRAFTATKRGVADISAGDDHIVTSGGGVVRITLQKADEEESVQIWPEEGWCSPLQEGRGALAFHAISVSLNPGDIIRFESTYQFMSGGSSPWQSTVTWDPIVEYQKIYPTLLEGSPAMGAADVPLNVEHLLRYDGELNVPEVSDVEVLEINEAGEALISDAHCQSLAMRNGSELELTYAGLKPFTSYRLRIHNICYAALDDSNAMTEELEFTTGPVVNIGDITPEGGNLKAGGNRIFVDVNNAAQEPLQAAFLAAVCKGTPEKYTIVDVRYTERDDIGANETLSVSIDLPSVEGYFVKAVLLEHILTARPYCAVKVLKGGS